MRKKDLSLCDFLMSFYCLTGDRLKAKNLLVVLGELVNIGVLNCYSFEQLISSIIDECSSSES
jgi:hypothetical protein